MKDSSTILSVFRTQFRLLLILQNFLQRDFLNELDEVSCTNLWSQFSYSRECLALEFHSKFDGWWVAREIRSAVYNISKDWRFYITSVQSGCSSLYFLFHLRAVQVVVVLQADHFQVDPHCPHLHLLSAIAHTQRVNRNLIRGLVIVDIRVRAQIEFHSQNYRKYNLGIVVNVQNLGLERCQRLRRNLTLVSGYQD